MSDDYYNILGVDKTADSETIKKAYKKLALKWHPDKNREPGADEMFKTINEAYAVLSDSDKRQTYDNFGKDGLNKHGMGGMHFDPMHMFNQMFGGNFGMFNNPMFNQSNIASPDIEFIEKLTLGDVFADKSITKEYTRNIICSKCKGVGSEDGKEHVCATCRGTKVVQKQTNMGMFSVINCVQCPTCHGTGSNAKLSCKLCNGSKVTKETNTVTFTIPTGTIDGETIIIQDGGNYSPELKTTGNLNVHIELIQHELFIRNARVNDKIKIDGYNLLLQLDISLADSLCGFSRAIKHVDKHDININVIDIIKTGDMSTITGEGLPNKNGTKGNLYILFSVNYPISLTHEQKNTLRQVLG